MDSDCVYSSADAGLEMKFVINSELQISERIEDNSKIFFLISQQNHML